MKGIAISFTVLALLVSNYALATTYTFTSAQFTEVSGLYTTDMRVTGTLITSVPIPPDSENFDIRPILTSFSFNDGRNTINSSAAQFFPETTPFVNTDSNGNITSYDAAVINTPLATTVGGTNDVIYVAPDGNYGFEDAICSELADGVCTTWNEGESIAIDLTEGVWVTERQPISESSPVPTLSQWSLMLLALLLAMVGIVRVKRQV